VTLRRLLSHTAGLNVSGYPGLSPGSPLPSTEASLEGASGAGEVRIEDEPGLLDHGRPSAKRPMRDGTRRLWHDGSNRGWQARLEVFPDRDWALVILADGDNGRDVIADVTRLIVRWRPSSPCARGSRAHTLVLRNDQGVDR
jgi:hypothetical protein